KARRPGVPVRNAVTRCGASNVEVGRGLRGLEHPLEHSRLAFEYRKIDVSQRVDELELFGEAEDRPCEPARPGRERRIALLAAWSAVRAVRRVEEALVRRAAAQIIVIALLAVVNAV